MSAAFGTQAFQQSRHARRIYVGGFPPNYGDEEALKFFLNSVIAKGLGEPNDNSYVLSIYVNQKKCFAFVELRAIELATACLDLDGIIYKKVVLKVLRANEYKPELIPPSMVGAPITLDLSSFSFGVPASPSNDKIGSASIQSSLTGNSTHPAASGSNENQPDARLDSVIQFASLSYISAGCISIIGYPFDDRSAPNHNNSSSSATKDGSMASGAHANALTSHSVTSANMNSSAPAATSGSGSGGYTGLGCTQAPKKMRNMIRKYKFGMLQNPEYDVDLKNLKFIDVGDVQAGKSREETKHNLSAIVAEVVQRRAVPFVVGGSSECAYYTTLGVISATARPMGMVVVSAQLEDLRVLEDPRLCERHSPKAAAARAHKQAQGPGQAPGTAVGIAESGAPGLVRAVSSHSQSLATTLPGDFSVASPVSTQETSQQQSQQSRSELDSPFGGMDRGGHCGGRYVRFAAQGIQCTTQQAENVTSKGGHVVWLGRDIRNQSTLCTLCPHLTSDHFAALAGRAVPHVYTLALFREALRCAAGKHAVPSAPTAGVAGVTADVSEKVEDEGLHPVYRAESRDFAADPYLESTPVEPSEKAPAVATETPSAAGLSDSAASAAPAEVEVEVVPGGVVVSIDMGVITGAVRGCGYITGSSNSTTGLTVDEILDMVMIAGADPNVLSLDISEFSPDAEDSRSSMLLAQMFYQFSLGVASRPTSASSAAKSLGRAVPPALPAEATAGGAGGAGGAEAFMYGEDATAMRVPFRLTVHDRSSEQLLLRDLGSLSRTPKFYQEVSSGSMEAFTSTNNGQAQPASEKPAQLPYIEVDHRFSSMDCLDHTGISMPVPDASRGISASSHSVSSGSTNTNHSGAHNNNTNNITINTNHPNNTNTNNTTKPPASPNHYVASPPTASSNLTASSESFSKSLYPSGMPPQYVNHSQSQRAALQAADASGMFTGMVRTSPAGTPVAAMRRLGSASTASSPPLGHRGINTAKSVPGPGQQGMMGMTGLYPSAALPRTNSTGNHLTQHQQLYAQQQQQQALLQQQQLQQHHALYNQPPPPQQQQRVNQPPPSYRSGPTPPASLQGPGQGQGQVHFGGSGAGTVPTAYAQQRARYEAEQTWGGDRVDPAGQNRYAQPAPSQRQQLMQAQHQQQQLYRLQQHQQQHQQQQQQAHNQAPLDDRSSSPSPHLYLSPDFLDISGERHSNALSSPSNSGYGDRQGGSSLHRSTNSTGSDLSGALAGLGVGVGAGSVDLSKPKSSLLGGSNELSGFDETVEMYEYRMQQQQQAQAQQLRGRSLQPQGTSQGLSSQGTQNSLSQSGLPRVGSALSYNTAAPMYSLYPADSMNFARSGSESLASNLTQDLMGSLSSSSSLLFTTSPHTPLTALGGGPSQANPSRMNSLSNTNNNNNNSSNNTIIDPEDTTGDFLQEHYNQFS